MNFRPALEDINFILHDVLNAPAQLQALPAFSGTDADLMRQVVDEVGKFVAQEVAPLQAVGDSVGCQFLAGKVTTRPGFKEAYQSFWHSGWPALTCAPEDGGQGLPFVLEAVLYERGFICCPSQDLANRWRYPERSTAGTPLQTSARQTA